MEAMAELQALSLRQLRVTVFGQIGGRSSTRQIEHASVGGDDTSTVQIIVTLFSACEYFGVLGARAIR